MNWIISTIYHKHVFGDTLREKSKKHIFCQSFYFTKKYKLKSFRSFYNIYCILIKKILFLLISTVTIDVNRRKSRLILLISSSTCSTAEKIGTYQFPFSTEKEKIFSKAFLKTKLFAKFCCKPIIGHLWWHPGSTWPGVKSWVFVQFFFLKIFSSLLFRLLWNSLIFNETSKLLFFSHFRALSVQNFGLKSIGIWVHYSACGLNVPSTEIQFLSLIWKK